MVMTELSSTQWLNSIWQSLTRGEDLAMLTMSRLEDLLSQNQQLLAALNDLQTAITHQPPPIIEIPQFSVPKVSKEKADPNIAVLAELFVKSQSANQVVLDQIKEVIKSQISADKQPTRIMAGGPKSVKLENDQGMVQDNWDDGDGGLKVHVQNPTTAAAGLTDTQLRATAVPVTLSNPTETGLAKDATLLRRYGNHVVQAGVVNTVGDNTLYTPASGKKIRLYWVALSTSQDNGAENLIQIKLVNADGTVKYRWRMGNPGAFVGSRTIDGNVNQSLVINLANTQPVDFNIDLEEV